MLKQHVSNSYDKQLGGQKSIFEEKTSWSSLGIGTMFAQILKGGSSSSWRPSLRMNAAWDDWLHSIGDAYKVPQPEFTWGRVNADQSDHATWIYEIFYVVGSNRKFYSPGALRSSARRGDDLPHPRTSDHWLVELRWSGLKTRRKPQDSSNHIVQRRIPAWLLENMEFQRVADECFDSWFANREIGLAGFSSLVSTMYECATKFLSTHVIIATSARQKLELALTAMRLLERHAIDERRLSRRCVADRDFAAIIELHVDLDVFDCTSVPLNVLERLAERCREQADVVIMETPARPDVLSDPAKGLRGHRQHESTLQSHTRIKQGTPLAMTELSDERDGNFTDDTARMEKLIQDAAQDRQGRMTSSPLHGQNLLDQWYANFSQCRTHVDRHEIESLILDSPNGKKPGPDGGPEAILPPTGNHLSRSLERAYVWAGLHRTCENVLRFHEMDCGTESGGRKYNKQITRSRARKRCSQSAGSDSF